MGHCGREFTNSCNTSGFCGSTNYKDNRIKSLLLSVIDELEKNNQKLRIIINLKRNIKLNTQKSSWVADKETLIPWMQRTEESEDQAQDLIMSCRILEKGEFSVLQSLTCQSPWWRKMLWSEPCWDDISVISLKNLETSDPPLEASGPR